MRAHTRQAWALVVVLAATAGCATNPVTGKRQLSLISEPQEIEMGRQAAQQARESIGLVEDPALQSYVQRIGRALAAGSERPDLPWSFQVVDDPTPNAFALPGGFIFVTRGMMNLMNSEAELASVLGHEIGHVTARHSVTQISRQQLAQLGLGLGGILVPEIRDFGQALGAGLQLLFLKHGRDDERQADELGFDYARAKGYDVAEMADVFAALERLGEREDGSALPSWLSTHPAPEERVQSVKKRLAAAPPQPDSARVGRAAYLDRIDGLVYGDNPRNGFFRGGVFYHPDLRFRFSVPEGWRTANLARAVVAVSPEQNAAAQLTLAGSVEPAQALQRLAAQQGIEVGQASRESLNGIPALVAPFQAQAEQGVVAGYAGYITYGGRTYQLVTYSPAPLFDRFDALFRQVIASFAPVSDPEILNVQPRRLDIVRLPRPETLEAFARDEPSSVPTDLLAILNQVQPASRLAAGTLLKRVVGEDPAKREP